MAPPPDTPQTVSSVDILDAIAERLAAGGELAPRITAVLDHARSTMGAEECSLWLHGARGMTCSVRSGVEVTSADAVQQALEAEPASEGDGFVVRRLASDGRNIGVLVARFAESPGAERRRIVGILANLLAQDLAGAERRHLLTQEVERGARQVDDERRFTQKIIDSLPVGLYVIDREYRVQAWNRNRETGHQGVSREQALGRTIFEVLHRQSPDSLRREFDEIFTHGRIEQFNIESTASGDARTYRMTKIPMRLSDGPVTHVITIGEDITDWTAAQERFAQSEKLAAVGQLAAGVMHEINNPLATIAACAESLSRRLDDLRQQGCDVPVQAGESTRIIDNEVHRCKKIIDGLLDFSRPRSVLKEPTDLNAVVEQAIFLLKHHAGFKDVRAKTLLDADLERTPANVEQLIQVVMALLINAADAMNGRGTVVVRTHRGASPEDAVVLEVIDEGYGIARTDLPKIFEPFYTTKPPGRGTGLGLSICYAIVAEHAGRIEVDSAVGAGSTFRVILPGVVVTSAA